jgi:hypothetical protein
MHIYPCRDNTYCCENITAVADDRPLIAQFCANEVESFNNAIKLMKEFVDGVDLNLGCPQTIARKGNYGRQTDEIILTVRNFCRRISARKLDANLQSSAFSVGIASRNADQRQDSCSAR